MKRAKFVAVASITPQVRPFVYGLHHSTLLSFETLYLQVLLGIHLLNSAAYYLKTNDHPFMLYQACKRPFSFYDTPLGYTLPLDSILLFIYYLTIIVGNFYLFLFLKSQTETNKALTSVDKKKERKRNFVSAKSGIISGFVLAMSIFVYSIFYGLKVCRYVNWCFSLMLCFL